MARSWMGEIDGGSGDVVVEVWGELGVLVMCWGGGPLCMV